LKKVQGFKGSPLYLIVQVEKRDNITSPRMLPSAAWWRVVINCQACKSINHKLYESFL